MSVTGIAGLVNITRGEISLSLPEDFFARVPAPVVVTITNRSRVTPLFLLRVSWDASNRLIPLVERGGSATATIPFTPMTRGVLPPVTVTISSSYPVGFFVRYRDVTVAPPATVFPHPLPTPSSGGLEGTGGVEEHPRERGGGGDIVTIREYHPGDPLRSIHWRLLARGEGVRVIERGGDAGGTVIIDPSTLPGADREERLSRAAWLVIEGFRQGRAVGLSLGGRSIPPGRGRGQRHQILKELALYDGA